ncbi:hypothetical protein D3C85_976740 [compost metagenome]
MALVFSYLYPLFSAAAASIPSEEGSAIYARAYSDTLAIFASVLVASALIAGAASLKRLSPKDSIMESFAAPFACGNAVNMAVFEAAVLILTKALPAGSANSGSLRKPCRQDTASSLPTSSSWLMINDLFCGSVSFGKALQ